jgi:hypothetical protein
LNLGRLIFQPFFFCRKWWCSVFCLLFHSFTLWRNARSCFHFQQHMWSLYRAYITYFIRKVAVYIWFHICPIYVRIK